MDPAHSGPIALRDGCLGDVAPTVLNVMGIPQPAEMTGKSLAEGHDFGRDRKMLLIICDGWGLGTGDEGDAIHLADTPTGTPCWRSSHGANFTRPASLWGWEPGKPATLRRVTPIWGRAAASCRTTFVWTPQ